MQTPSLITVAIADDHKLIRQSLALLINNFPGITVTLQAGDGKALLEALATAEVLPDVCLLDISMKPMNGYDTLPLLKQKYPELKVIVVSVNNDNYSITRMIHLGASAYITKGADPADMHTAIRQVYEHGYHYTGLITKDFFRKAQKMEFRTFTPREKEYMQYATTNLTHQAIGLKMGVSKRTVDEFCGSASKKLNVRTRLDLAMHIKNSGVV
jgi:two-component system invasion response regulator UvrY